MFPADLGFKMPPEWHKHVGTFMEWPVVEAGWPGPFDEVKEAFAEIANKICDFEPVIMITNPEQVEEVKEFCGDRIKIFELKHDDSWMRDNGPTFLINNKEELAGINWGFNAWGGKYAYENDNKVAEILLASLDVPIFDALFIMEGGSIHVDGEGTLLTTEECLLNLNRNPHLKKEQVEEQLKKYLNVEKIIWLEKGLFGDDTDGHIDNVACFAKPGTVLLQTCKDKNDPNFLLTQKNLEVLNTTLDAKGRKLEIIELPHPQVDLYEDMQLTLSYMNFYFVNGGIILPVFGGKHEKTDNEAKEILEKVFVDRKIVTVNGMPIIRGGGNVHCLTQQMPVGIPAIL